MNQEMESKSVCETCGRELLDDDNIIGRWCDDVCADDADDEFNAEEDEEDLLDYDYDDGALFDWAED